MMVEVPVSLLQMIENWSLAQKVLGLPSIGALLAFVWVYALRPTARFLVRLNAGAAAGIACQAGLDELRKKLEPNGGDSVYDKVERAAASADAANRSSRITSAKLTTMMDVVVQRALFQADTDGAFTWVNAELEKTFETSCDAMAGRGWVNLLLPADRDRVLREFKHAIRDRRSLVTSTRCVSQRSGVQFVARLACEPVLDEAGDGAVIAWLGAIDPQRP